MVIDLKFNVGTVLLLGVIGGLCAVINKKSSKIAQLSKENEELRSAINVA